VIHTPTIPLTSIYAFALLTMALWLPPSITMAQSQGSFVVTPLAERKVEGLPEGPLYWRLETFRSLSEAEEAAGSTSLVVGSVGKVWLVTLGPRGMAIPDGNATLVAEIGPLPDVTATEYLLRVNGARGPLGSKSVVHTHPGSESFYVLNGQMGQTTSQGTTTSVGAGQWTVGLEPETPMEVVSTGAAELDVLVMFVVDATKPFSTAAHLD
jgi:hypothetical protein